jgi:hypothetical protein
MPRRVRLLPALSQVSRDHGSEMVRPTRNRLVGHRQSALGQQILDVTQAEGKPEVEPYCLVNDLGRETIPAVADFLRPLGYSTTDRTASTTRRDNARGSNKPAERRADRLGAVLGSPRPRSPSGSAPSGRSTAQRGQGPSPHSAGCEGLSRRCRSPPRWGRTLAASGGNSESRVMANEGCRRLCILAWTRAVAGRVAQGTSQKGGKRADRSRLGRDRIPRQSAIQMRARKRLPRPDQTFPFICSDLWATARRR